MTTVVTTQSAPGALPLLGHALQLGRAPLRFLTSLPAHGDVVRIRLGPWPAYVVCRPDLVQRVLSDDHTFDKGGPFIDAFRTIVGNGLGLCSHQQHRRRRRLLQPAFHRARLADYAAVMSEQIAAVIEPWHDGQVVDFPAVAHEFATTVAIRTLFAAGASTTDIAEIHQCVSAVLAGVHRRVLLPVPALDRIPTRGNLRFARARRRLRQLTVRLVDRYRRAGIDHGDVLSLLLAARDERDEPLTDAEIHDEVVQFLLAGIEAMPPLLSWIWLLLDRHPDVRAELHAEVDTVLAGRIAHHDDLPHLEATPRIVAEALRLYPPGWIMTRTTTTGADLAGHHIPAGTTVVYSPYLAGRQGGDYTEPDRFDPGRWRTASPARGAFVAFGGGPRVCIGDRFATVQATLAVASIAARWRLHVVPGTRTDPVAHGVLAPRALPVRVRRRSVDPPQQKEEAR
ncbi:cytochrome P450 [Amycolatopsis lurida]